ncbi:hypothetical protein C0993_005578 [Termitomyces sp. T159_Od127]|nr:hypothetical protein C0993_005578 [Termitomyces sp. T159_Od127]
MLQVNLNLQNKLCALVDKIYTSPTIGCFEDPVDLTCSFHVQCKEPIKPWDPVSTLVLCQQEELNVALNILKALNSTEGLFDQPAAHTIGLLACPHANSLSSTFHIWEQFADANPCPDAPLHPLPANNDHASTYTLSYINKLEALSSALAPPGRAPPQTFDVFVPLILTCTISVAMHSLPAKTHHPFANLWAQCTSTTLFPRTITTLCSSRTPAWLPLQC